MLNADGTKGMERGISNEIEGLEKNLPRNMKNDGTDVSYEIIEEKFDEVFEDELYETEDDGHYSVEFIKKYHKGCGRLEDFIMKYIKYDKVKISAKKNKIIIEKIGEE